MISRKRLAWFPLVSGHRGTGTITGEQMVAVVQNPPQMVKLISSMGSHHDSQMDIPPNGTPQSFIWANSCLLFLGGNIIKDKELKTRNHFVPESSPVSEKLRGWMSN